MTSERIPSYYSIIPAKVRYDARISGFDMVLFSELTAMSTVHGYAEVSNAYLCSLYSKAVSTITESLAKLARCGHITLQINKEMGNARRIYVVTPPLPENRDRGIPDNRYTSVSLQETSFNKETSNKKGLATRKSSSKNERPDVVIDWLDDYIKNIK